MRLLIVIAIYLSVKNEWPIDGWNEVYVKEKEDEKPTQASQSKNFLKNAAQTLIATHLLMYLSLYSL